MGRDLKERVKDVLRPTYYKIAHIHVRKKCEQTKKEFEALNNKHKGETCFIVANGPSLRIEDLEVIRQKKVPTLGMNRIYKLYDKTTWRPTYYLTQDPHLIRRTYKEAISATKDSVVFQRSTGESRFDFPSAVFYEVDYARSWKNQKPIFSDCSNCIVEDGTTVTYSVLQIAVYMGFKTIYLIGCDCNYSPDNSITRESYPDPRMYDEKAVGCPPDIAYQFMAYKVARDECEKKGVKVYNATRGGKLEIFDRVDLDEVLAQI